MYILVINDDDTIISTQRERIVQRSKKTNTIRILTKNEYNGVLMNECKAVMFYKLPISGEWKSMTLTPQEELYKDQLVDYQFVTDTWLTTEAGDVEIQIRFYEVDLDGNIQLNQYVRKATDGVIHISSSKDWASGIADPLLDTLDQRIIQLMAAQTRQEEMINGINDDCPTSLGLTDGKIHLVTSDGEIKGDSIEIVTPRVLDDDDGTNDGMIDLDGTNPSEFSGETGSETQESQNGFIDLDE